MQAVIEQALHKASKHSQHFQTLVRWRPVLGRCFSVNNLRRCPVAPMQRSFQCTETVHEDRNRALPLQQLKLPVYG